MDVHRVMMIREEMERMEMHKLQPHFVEAFFREAFRLLGGDMLRREHGRWEIPRVPARVRERNSQIARKYERICFDRSLVNVPGKPVADQLCPGHPLLEAVIDLMLRQSGNLLKQGTVFIDDMDYSTEPRMLFMIENNIHDARRLENGESRLIRRSLEFVELMKSGLAKKAGFAPYLDYRTPTEEERALAMEYVNQQEWLSGNVEELATDYATETIVPELLRETRKQRIDRVNKTIKAVRERLTEEIQYWDRRANELRAREAMGKKNAKLNASRAEDRADELESRMQKRLRDLEEEKIIRAHPPVVTGGAFVIPKGLMDALKGVPVDEAFAKNRTAVEIAAMKAVMERETALGYTPRDVSLERLGYDIESSVPESQRANGCLRFIEVKGRQKGATTIMATKNEITCALNNPDQFILAIVMVDGDRAENVLYLKRPFINRADMSLVASEYRIEELMRTGEVIQ